MAKRKEIAFIEKRITERKGKEKDKNSLAWEEKL